MYPVDPIHRYVNSSIPESLNSQIIGFLTPDPPAAETLKPSDFNPEP